MWVSRSSCYWEPDEVPIDPPLQHVSDWDLLEAIATEVLPELH